MKIYLAAKYFRNPEMRDVKEILQKENIEVISSWIEGNQLDEVFLSIEERNKIAKRDLTDLSKSEILLWFSETNTAKSIRGARHVEFGYALALGIPIYVIGEKENIFHYMSSVKHFENLVDCIEELKCSF